MASAQRILQMDNQKWPDQLTAIPREKWPARAAELQHESMIGVWRSKNYFVQGFAEPDGIVRLSICRTELNSRGQWRGGLGWDELQSIKAQCGYGDRDAVEVYPRDIDVVNVANFRHLWVLPGLVQFAWRKDRA